MSDGDVSLIQDEDLLRRMWQQTEDFSRKKEIRAHMYRLREERLRNLYSPEPKHDGKDLKALSNAGWNVEQENKTTDDGRTHVKSINANIEGRYDVDGGKGQFAAVDHHKEAVTEYHDDNSSLKRNETSSNTAAREHVVRQTNDGTHVSSTTNSSTSTSKVQQMSSTRHESVPYTINDDYDPRSYDTNRNDNASSVTRRQITKTNDYEQNLRSNEYEQTLRQNDYETGELVSRKVDYPDDNTRVIVETRCLPDGTRVTSTKREFRAPVQSTRAEQVYQTRSENRSYSTQQRSNKKDSSKVIHHVIDNRDYRPTDIVDSQRNVDDYDFNKQVADNSTRDTDDYSNTQHYEKKVNKSVIDHSKTDDDYSNIQRTTKINRSVVNDDNSNIQRNVTKINKTVVDHSKTDDDYSNIQRYKTTTNKKTTDSSKTDDNYSKIHRETNVNQRVVDHSKTDDDYNHTTRYVTRTHKTIESNDNDDYVQTHRETNQRRYDTTDDERRKVVITHDDRNIHEKDYKDVQPRDTQPRSSKPREPSIPTESYPRDSQPSVLQPQDTQPKDIQPKSTEKIVNITRNEKVEEIIENKTNTEQRQTTYQSDFSHKKISNDWSPSHTAWASTLRGDTPSTTRPSTRASSPGSKTFKSSTSSLRSSVSPDKTNRKPLSRGSSPNKIERSSPTRLVPDQHYTTHSTHSVTEVKSHKYSTPDERRPPTGRHSSGGRYSPERKPQDHRQRPSVSPEKRPQDLVYRSSVSPDRKPTIKSPIDSPVNRVDRQSPTRPRQSPERKLPQHPSSVSGYPSSPNRSTISPEKAPVDHHPKHQTTRPTQSPDRKPDFQKPVDGRPQTSAPTRGFHPADTTQKHDRPSSPTTKDTTPNRGSVSPDRKPGYMTPTASSQPTDVRKSPTKLSEKMSSTKHTPFSSPTRKPQDHTTPYKKYQEDHYKFIDEETKMYTRTDKTRTDTTKRTPKGSGYSSPRDNSPSPTRKSPIKDIEDIRKVPGRRSPSPKQQTDVEKHDRVDTTIKTTDVTDNITTTYCPKNTDSLRDKTVPKQLSPSKPGAQDKTRPSTEAPEEITRNKISSPTEKIPSKDTDFDRKVPGRRSPSPKERATTTEKHDRIDTSIKTSKVTDNVITTYQSPKDKNSPRDKTVPRQASPTKFGTYDKKKPHTDTPEQITTEKSPSLTRSSNDDTDFIGKVPERRSSSPKERITAAEKHDRIDTSIKTSKVTDNVHTTYHSPTDKDSPRDKTVPKQPSPTKFVTYEKKKPHSPEQITREKSPSPTRRSPDQNTHVTRKVPGRRSPSPKERITAAEKYNLVDTTIKTGKVTDDVITTSQSPKDKDSPRDKILPRQPSPTKFGTYDRKKSHTDTPEEITREKSPSPTRRSPEKDTDVIRKVPGRRSPSPKERITAAEKYNRVDTTIKTSKVTDDVITTYQSPKDKDSPRDKTIPRQPSPTKFGTYDKKKPHIETPEEITREKSPSPTRRTPSKDTDVVRKVPGRSPSPKRLVTKTEKQNRTDTTIKTNDVIDTSTTTYSSPKDMDSPRDKTDLREPSPSKFGTYDKRKPHTDTTETITTTKDIKYDSLKRGKSPKKSPEQSMSPTRKAPELPASIKKVPERPTSSSKQIPRDSVSPVKSPTRNTKYKHTTDFLTSERTTEEVNKKTTKEHPRQLVTPSSSPTRKPQRPTDPEPSTGQSSPTTSVSGFVYFSSPRTEETVVTDLDDQESYTEIHSLDETITTSKRPESLVTQRSPSPSKIPCRSPSPERHTSPPKDSLPRKSSLKKPVTDTTQASPVEKPPTSFRVSPTEEPKELPGHKVLKKDHADEPKTKAPIKSKPPLERRETYEDRCRKILGMTEDTTETVMKQTSYYQEPETNTSSPSISPCRSPAPKDTPFEYPTTKKVTDANVNVMDFIKHEKENIVDKTGKTPYKTSRDSSPTKLQDIITVKKTVIESDVSTKDIEEIDVKKSSTTEYPEPRMRPQRKSQTVEDTPSNILKHIPTPRESPERPSHQKQKDTEFIRSTSPAKLHPGSSPRSSSSPERKPKYEPKDKTQLKEPKDKTLGSLIETTTTVSTKYDTDEDTEQITVTTKKTGKKPSPSSDSRMRKLPGDTISQPKELVHDEPSKTLTRPSYLESTISMVVEYGSTEDLVESVQESVKTQLHPSEPSKPTTKPSQSSPSRTLTQEQPSKVSSDKKTGNKPKDSSPTRPSHTKSSVISKYESTTENVKETSISEGIKHKTIHSKISEISTRKTPKEVDDFEPDRPSDKTSKRKPSDTQEKPLRISTSTEQKSNDKYAEDLSPTHGIPKKVPSYTKTTKSTTSKNDTISAEDYEKTTTLKTGRHHPSKPSESPTLKADKSGDYPHAAVLRPQDTDKGSDISTSYKPTPTANEKSPDRYNTKKAPHYMTPVSPHSHIHETETTTEDEYEQRTSTEYETLQRSDSPTHLSTRDTPHYMQSIPPHRHTHGTISSIDLQETRTHELNAHKPQSEKTPHYMTPISSHLHKHETITTEEDVETSTVMEERHPSGDKFPESDYPHTGSRTHPTASAISIKQSPERKTVYQQPSEQNKKLAEKHPEKRSPTKKIYASDTPGCIKTSTTTISKHDTTDDYEETTLTESTKRRYESPTRKTPSYGDSPKKPYHKDDSPSRKPKDNRTHNVSPDRKPGASYRDDSSPRRRTPVDKTPDYMRTTTSITSKYDSTTEDVQEQVSLTTEKHHLIPRQPSSPSVQKGPKHTPDTVQTVSPSKPYPDSPIKKPSMPKDVNKKESSLSPDRKAGYRKPTTSVASKHDIINTDNIETAELKVKQTSSRSSVSPSPDEPSRTRPGYLKEPEEPRQLRTPSPSKKTMKVTEVSTDFLMSEREQEILDRVQKSLRKLSPERKEKSPSRERSPEKTTTSLQDIDINITTQNQMRSEEVIEFTKKQTSKTDITSPRKPKEETPKDQKVPSKPSSRNTSPTKKPSGIASPTKIDKGPESTAKPRSISPKKPMSSAERPQSPLPKASGIKPKEQIPSHLTRKPTPATLATTKVEKTTSDLKKTTGVTTTKQNSFTKVTTSKTTTKSTSSPTGRPSEPRTPTPKGIRESGIPKKEIDTKVTRTVSEITIKSKKLSPTSPQRMKSKPEIQVSDMSTLKSKPQKSSLKEPQSKLPGKPKSATTLNTPSDEDDIIIDVQQSKSSRENSPDRICPTPVNFGDDVGIPRYPDEVKEPEDEFRKRTHHIIHETESIVDDIVEISEDDELFVRKSDIEHLTEEDESLLTVTDKVTKFTKGIDTTTKPKDTTNVFKDTERRVHSDFEEKNLQSDECLLSVSEKVNKFAKGPRDIKDKSPARRVVDEYDKNTVYTDDYTKLSVHDKAHLFVETAENVKTPKTKPAPQRVERPDLTNVDEALKSDDCLLSVSDKVHKFVKTAEQFLTETQEVDEKEKKIKEQHEKIMKKIVDDVNDDTYEIEETTVIEDEEVSTKKIPNRPDDKASVTKVTSSSHSKVKDYSSPYLNKPTERPPTVKITTLRSSEAVKKAKALFENIASTTPKTKDATHSITTTKLTDIGVTKKSPKTDSTKVFHPSVEEVSRYVSETDTEVDSVPIQSKERPTSGIITRPHLPRPEDKPRASPTRLTMQSPDGRRSKSPMRHTVETTTTTKTMLTKYPTNQRPESPKNRPEGEKPEKVPGYLRPTKTSQIKEEPKVVEEKEVSSRRGSGKFGVELRRTSVERSTVSSERRRSVEHPCIEDIFDLDLLEQMLEKVVGYEQRRRIRAQIRIARKNETEHVGGLHTAHTRTSKQITITQKDRSSERHQTRSPDRAPKTKPHKTASPDRQTKTPQRTILDRSQPIKHDQLILNGHGMEPVQIISDKRSRPQSPTKVAPKSALKTKSPIRPVSPDKKTRTQSPSKTASPKPKANRFNEYAFAYMKKVGLNEAEKHKFTESKKKTTEEKQKTVKQVEEHEITEEFSTSKKITQRSPSEEVIEVIQMNGSKRSPSPEKRQSPERKSQSRERFHERSPSPDKKQPTHHTKPDPLKKETIIKTVYEIEKKIPQKQTPEHKPSWVTERNLKKITPETRTYSSKKIEEKPRYRVPSPSKVISKPIDVITSSYGPGPLDAEGKPLFGIKALRNGASNYQVKGTVIRQEYHSRNGSEPEGTVSVTAYSTEPEELEQLLQRQGEQPSRIHGLAAITTTKKFGGDTGTTLKEIHGKEERAAIDQFTHSDRRVSDTRIEDVTESFSSRQEITGDTRRIETRKEEIVGDIITDRAESKTERMQKRVERGEKVERRGDRVERKERPDDKKTVRQSSVKSLTEKYIKSANESTKAERPAYPKAGLILRTATMKDSVSSDSSAHAGLARTDSEHSLGSVEDTVVTTERCEGGVRTITTTTRSHGHVTHTHHETEPERVHTERSFLDSNTKVSGVQDILTRMKNADIVIQEGDTSEDTEARALLNKFLGATVLMAGMQSYVTEKPSGKVVVKQETVRTSSNSGGKVTSSQTRSVQEFDIDQCWDERVLRKLLDECNDYEQRRRLRARIRTLMAEQEACASAVTEALAAAGEAPEDNNEAREEEEVTVTSSVRRNSSEKTVSSSTTTTKTSKVIDSMTRPAPKPVSPFAKFRQLEKQNSTNSPKM